MQFLLIIAKSVLILSFYLDPHLILLFGLSPLSSYNSLLSTLLYINSAPEPTYPTLTRILSVEVNDGQFIVSNFFAISIQLLNDNLLSLSLLADSFDFVEGTSSLPIGSLARLSLSDEDKGSL